MDVTVLSHRALTVTSIRPGDGMNIGDYGHALIAVSLFNSYYSTDRIKTLVRWAKHTFERSHIPVFDLPHAYTLSARKGHSPGSVRRARKEGRKLHNKIVRIHAEEGIDSDAHRLLTWDDLVRNDDYLQLRVDVDRAFCTDACFRQACLTMADTLLDPEITDEDDRRAACFLAARYLLDELPLLIDLPSIIKSDSSVFLYHRAPALLKQLFEGRFTLKPSDRQGYFILSDASEIEAADSY